MLKHVDETFIGIERLLEERQRRFVEAGGKIIDFKSHPVSVVDKKRNPLLRIPVYRLGVRDTPSLAYDDE